MPAHVIEPRIYRAAFVPALIAVVLAMFSLESRPPPLPQGLAADVVFDGDGTAATTRAVVAAGEDRRAGRPGNLEAARFVRRNFERRGFTVQTDSFTRDGRRMANVIGRRAGKSRRQLVVVAARDARGIPDAAGSAADTAALVEIARVFEGRPSEKTLVLASVDGSALGELGTSRLVDRLESPERVDAVLVLSGLGAPGGGATSVEAWSGDSGRAGLGLQRTLAESLRQEEGSAAEGSSSFGQFARLALPLGIGPQGVLLEEGYDAVRLAGDGELSDSGSSTAGQIDRARLERLGRATLRTLTALDQGPRPQHGPDTYITAVSQVVPGWVLSLLSFTLILPALVASVDAFARSRRRRVALVPWLGWLGAGALAFLVGLGLLHVLALVNATPDPPDAPVSPGFLPLDGPALGVLGGVALVVALTWFALRFLVSRADPELRDPSAPGAAVACALVLSLACLALWALNPYTALLLAPALHLWMLATVTEVAPPRGVRVAMVAGGLLPLALLVLYECLALSVDPLHGAWYLAMLVAGGHVGLSATLIACVLAGTLGSVIAIVRTEPAAPSRSQPGNPSVRGPASYAGPGSLGGTSSAIPRR